MAGELYAAPSSKGVRVPNGFVLTAGRFLTKLGIDSVSVNPPSIMRTMTVMRHAEDFAKRESWQRCRLSTFTPARYF
jgi:phosphoenolpyruvate synthase/pyruvate phosphate dikinase